MEGLFPDEDYPVAVFVRTFAVEDLPATEVGNLLLDSFELDIEFVGEGFPGQRGVIYKGVDDALGRFPKMASLYRGILSSYRGRFCGYRVLSFVGEASLFHGPVGVVKTLEIFDKRFSGSNMMTA